MYILHLTHPIFLILNMETLQTVDLIWLTVSVENVTPETDVRSSIEKRSHSVELQKHSGCTAVLQSGAPSLTHHVYWVIDRELVSADMRPVWFEEVRDVERSRFLNVSALSFDHRLCLCLCSYLLFSSHQQVHGPANSQSKVFSDLVQRCLSTVPSRLEVPFNPAEFWSCYRFHNKVRLSVCVCVRPAAQLLEAA